MARKSNHAAPKLTDPELDLLAHTEHGYRLETDSLGRNPLPRRFKDEEVIRPVSVNRNTIKAMEKARADKTNEGTRPACYRAASDEKDEVNFPKVVTCQISLRDGSDPGPARLHYSPVPRR